MNDHSSHLEDRIDPAMNPEPRCLVELVLDRSGSMNGKPIEQLNAGLQAFKESLLQDQLASLRVEVAVISFDGEARLEVDFSPPATFDPPVLQAGGGTSLGAAIITALDLLESRMAKYRAEGIAMYKPWLIVITDAESSDDTTEAAKRIKDLGQRRRLSFFGIGVLTADMEKLAQFSDVRPPVRLEGLQFRELFQWVSCNLSTVAASRVGEQIPLTPPGWQAA